MTAYRRPRMGRMERGAALLVALWAGSACGPAGGGRAGGPEQESGLLESLNAVEAGDLREVPVAPWHIGSTPLFRVGGADDRESHQFAEVTAAVVRGDGAVAVADGRMGVVRVYAPSGDLLMELGTVGDGPGEFRSPSDLLAGPMDSIRVWDRARWTTSVFGPGGEFVYAERYEPTNAEFFPLAGMWPSEIRMGSGGLRLVRLVPKPSAKQAKVATNVSAEGLVGFAVHGPAAAAPDLIATLPRDERVEITAPWGPAQIVPPLATGPSAAVGRHGQRVCLGHRRFPEVLCADIVEGRVGVRRGVRWTGDRGPVRSDDPDIGRWREATTAAYGPKTGPALAEEVVSLVPLPVAQPAFRGLHVDALECLWVELGPSAEGADTRDYLIFDRELNVVGRLTVPPIQVLDIGEDYLLGARSDSLGVKEVVMLPLAR